VEFSADTSLQLWDTLWDRLFVQAQWDLARLRDAELGNILLASVTEVWHARQVSAFR
jgi:hypothetical protein